MWQPPQHRAPSVPQAWAVYKGKYHEGTDKADPSTWKTRLRCALNKSTDFQEVPERSQLDISEPYKVYQIVTDRACDAGTSLPSLFLCQMFRLIPEPCLYKPRASHTSPFLPAPLPLWVSWTASCLPWGCSCHLSGVHPFFLALCRGQ